MIHLYHGNGKGKTTAACGLAIRAAGSGMRVLFVQFLKDGGSSEIGVLSSVPKITVLCPGIYHGWVKALTERQKTELKEEYASLLRRVAGMAKEYDLIVLDEAVAAYRHGLLEKAELLAFLTAHRACREIVLTGRAPAPELLETADYVTEMKKEKHPFDRGVNARRGIEY